jgi:hypothetical protein
MPRAYQNAEALQRAGRASRASRPRVTLWKGESLIGLPFAGSFDILLEIGLIDYAFIDIERDFFVGVL